MELFNESVASITYYRAVGNERTNATQRFRRLIARLTYGIKFGFYIFNSPTGVLGSSESLTQSSVCYILHGTAHRMRVQMGMTVLCIKQL